MSQPDDGAVEHKTVRNEEIVLPPALTSFLDERYTAVQEEFLQPLPEDLPVVTYEAAEKQADVNRRLLEKLGILSEVEEIQKLDREQGPLTR
jgi:hypothetical protein